MARLALPPLFDVTVDHDPETDTATVQLMFGDAVVKEWPVPVDDAAIVFRPFDRWHENTIDEWAEQFVAAKFAQILPD